MGGNSIAMAPRPRWIYPLSAALGLSAVAAVGLWHASLAATTPDPVETLPLTHPTDSPRHSNVENVAEYSWPRTAPRYESLAERFPPPAGFNRIRAIPGSFQAWLRDLPLRPIGTPVRAFDGRLILAAEDPRLAAVLDWDLSTKDLQQCADSIIRLRAEWAYHRNPHADIGFDFTSGHRCSWCKWRLGYRPAVLGDSVRFFPTAGDDDSEASFRDYLNKLFQYAGTVSLYRESRPAILGDGRPAFLIHPGTPGHVIQILDCATDSTRPGQFALLLGQGYMPAQDFHILTAPDSSSAWHQVPANTLAILTHYGSYSLVKNLRTFPPIANLPE